MTQILVIDSDTVLIDGADIGFGDPPTPPPPPFHPLDVAQLSAVAIADGITVPEIAQLAFVSAAEAPPIPVDICQLAIVQIVSGNIKLVCLGEPIKLDCWQPCTAYGTPARIFYYD